METIPTINESHLHFTISKRYQGAWEVSIFYAGVPIKRYTLGELAAKLFSCILSEAPVPGFWLFSSDERDKKLATTCSRAIDTFTTRVKLDVADSIWDGNNNGGNG